MYNSVFYYCIVQMYFSVCKIKKNALDDLIVYQDQQCGCLIN